MHPLRHQYTQSRMILGTSALIHDLHSAHFVWRRIDLSYSQLSSSNSSPSSSSSSSPSDSITLAFFAGASCFPGGLPCLGALAAISSAIVFTCWGGPLCSGAFFLAAIAASFCAL